MAWWMAQAAPKVTIIMATYNWSSVLPYSIGSALQQDFGHFELLVVGDGCTDDSAEVVEAIGDPRVRWINLPRNHGHQWAPNNEGLRQARGELIAYLGHDDLWLPHHLSSLVTAIETGGGAAFTMIRLVAPGTDVDGIVARTAYRPGDWVVPSSTIHRRTLTDEVGGWQDYRALVPDPETDLWSRFHAAGACIVTVPRLTAIKFPAALRPNVYRQRPCHEQAEWFARIQAGEEIEAIELGKALAPALAAQQPRPFFALLAELVRRAATTVPRRIANHRAVAGMKKGQRIEQNRRRKGLVDDHPATSASLNRH